MTLTHFNSEAGSTRHISYKASGRLRNGNMQKPVILDAVHRCKTLTHSNPSWEKGWARCLASRRHSHIIWAKGGVCRSSNVMGLVCHVNAMLCYVKPAVGEFRGFTWSRRHVTQIKGTRVRRETGRSEEREMRRYMQILHSETMSPLAYLHAKTAQSICGGTEQTNQNTTTLFIHLFSDLEQAQKVIL